MDFLARKEYESLKYTQSNIENSLNAEKLSFERQLKNGLGEEIKNELKSPTKPKKIDLFKYKISRFLKLFE